MPPLHAVARSQAFICLPHIKPTVLATEALKELSTLCAPRRLATLRSPKIKLLWAKKIGEALCKLEEAENLNEVHYSQGTTRKGAQALYDRFVEKISPRAGETEEVVRKAVLSQFAEGAVPKVLRMYLDIAKIQQGLFHVENIPLLAKEEILGNGFNNITAPLKASCGEGSVSLSELASKFPRSSRVQREKIWRAIWGARSSKKAEYHQLLDELIPLRLKIKDRVTPNLKMDDYYYRRIQSDFTSGEVAEMFEGVRAAIIPVTRAYYKKLTLDLGVSFLRPWDVSPTRYFEYIPIVHEAQSFSSPAALLEDTLDILGEISPRLKTLFKKLKRQGLIDVDPREGKATNAFAAALPSSRTGFMLAELQSTGEACGTIVHEFGHALHFILAAKHSFGPNRHSNFSMETAEIASTGLEMLVAAEILTNKKWENSPRHLEIARTILLNQILFPPYVAQLVSFQSWLYANPNHTHTDRETKWAELDSKFAPAMDWSGVESVRGCTFIQQKHLFASPFYYPQYMVAGLGALSLFTQYVEGSPAERKKIVARYFKGLALGGSVPGREVYGTIGVPFLPNTEQIAKVINPVKKYL